MDADSIVLGSGDVYVMEFSGDLPEDATIETEANRLGYIQGGASIEYKPTFYEAKDDFKKKVKTIVTEEEATFKTGIFTWFGETLEKLCSTARVTDDAEGKVRTVKIGGAENNDGKRYVIHFVHKDKADGDVRVTIVGKNQSGFTLAFAQDKETVIDAEFRAEPCDDDGTLIVYKETYEAA